MGQHFVADLITIGSRAEMVVFFDLRGAEMLAWGRRPWARRCDWHWGCGGIVEIFWYRNLGGAREQSSILIYSIGSGAL